MTTLHTQVVGKLAAGLESTVRVTTVVCSAVALGLVTVLVGSMAALDAEVMSELAAGLEGAVWVALEAVSHPGKEMERGILTPLSLLLAPPVVPS